MTLAACNKRFGSMVAGRWNFNSVLQSAAVPADVILMSFCLLPSSFVFLLGFISKLDVIKFHHIFKPYPLWVMESHRVRMSLLNLKTIIIYETQNLY